MLAFEIDLVPISIPSIQRFYSILQRTWDQHAHSTSASVRFASDSELGQFPSRVDKGVRFQKPLRGPKNFSEAKYVARQIYRAYPFTFYCGCGFDHAGNIDLKRCGYKVQADLVRASRLEWEHIVPMSQMASHLTCWKTKACVKENGIRYKGRMCCRTMNTDFAKMEADLHNLVPEIGELNGCRANYRFGLLPYIRENRFGLCQFKVDPKIRRVEPQEKVRGMIARIYLYVGAIYGIRLNKAQQQLFNGWNKAFPPDTWEKKREAMIAEIQGNHNPYISEYEKMIHP